MIALRWLKENKSLYSNVDINDSWITDQLNNNDFVEQNPTSDDNNDVNNESSVTSDLECNMPAMNVLYKKQKLEDLLFILYQVMVIVYFHQCHISCQTSVNSLSMLVYVTRYTKT